LNAPTFDALDEKVDLGLSYIPREEPLGVFSSKDEAILLKSRIWFTFLTEISLGSI